MEAIDDCVTSIDNNSNYDSKSMHETSSNYSHSKVEFFFILKNILLNLFHSKYDQHNDMIL